MYGYYTQDELRVEVCTITDFKCGRNIFSAPNRIRTYVNGNEEFFAQEKKIGFLNVVAIFGETARTTRSTSLFRANTSRKSETKQVSSVERKRWRNEITCETKRKTKNKMKFKDSRLAEKMWLGLDSFEFGRRHSVNSCMLKIVEANAMTNRYGSLARTFDERFFFLSIFFSRTPRRNTTNAMRENRTLANEC